MLPNVCVGLGSFFLSSALLANPVLNNIEHGNVTVQQTSTTTTINQSSQQAILNWQSFNIQQGEHTHFEQPTNGVALNRISGSQGASEIYGHLSATGQIILINPAGVFFSPSAFVNVGGLIASTANITNADFLSGNFKFNQVSPDAGMIINKGTIIAAQNGLVMLLGNGVQNDGTIQANLGKVVLASGSAFTLDFVGNGLVNFAVDAGSVKGITNTGTISANGGQVIVSAKAASNVLDQVINMDGIVEAKAVELKQGQIILSSDLERGMVIANGELNVSGKNAGEHGGNVSITGNLILVDENANIDASGDTGGGYIYIGGNYLGQGPLPNSSAVVMLPGASIHSDALTDGDGGTIILWSNDLTRAHGDISARGGSLGGDGGFIETSSKHILEISNLNIDTSAANGNNGLWLLDPADLEITSVDANITSSSPFTPSAASATLDVDTLTTALETSDVTVLTSNDGLSGSGNIIVSVPITWEEATTLLLDSYAGININAPITANLGTLQLRTSNSNNAITPNSSADINVYNFELLRGQWNQIGTGPGTIANFNVTNNFSVDSLSGTDNARFFRVLDGNGSSGDPYQITDIYGLQGIGTHTSLTASLYWDLANSIDATMTRNWNNGVGFIPITPNTSQFFWGFINGNNYVIDGLYINRPSSSYVGLIGYQFNDVYNLGLTNVDITGSSYVGGITGYGYSGNTKVLNSFVTGSVSGSYYVGGIVGYTWSHINHGGYYDSLWSGADVSGTNYVGGIIGYSRSTISNSYSTGSVTGTGSYTGGIAGYQANNPSYPPSITSSYSTATVSGSTAGAIVGYLAGGTLANNYYDTETSGGVGACGIGSCGTGQVDGLTTAQMTDINNFTGFDITDTGGSTTPSNKWFIFDGSTRPMLLGHHTENISTSHQLQLAGTTLGASYNLASNINMYDGMNNIRDIWVTDQSASTGKGFVPIGGSGSGSFTGSLNGNDYAINNLYIKRSGEGIALFGRASGATIQNLALRNVSITNTDGYHTAAVVGLGDQNTFRNINISGSITIDGTSLGYNNGGVIGLAYGASTTTIDNVYSNVKLSGRDNFIGGLVGVVGENTTLDVDDSYVAGSVHSGGPAGYGYAAGLVASADANSVINIDNSYSIATISGNNAQGLVGRSLGELNISNTFWDTDKSGQSAYVDYYNTGTMTNVLGGCLSGTCSNGGTANLSSQNLYDTAGWDLATTWNIIDGASYPYHRRLYTSTPRIISGSVSGDTGGTVVTLNTENASSLATDVTGPDGSYYIIQGANAVSDVNGAISDGDLFMVYLNTDGGAQGATVSVAKANGASTTDLAIASNTVTINLETEAQSLPSESLSTLFDSNESDTPSYNSQTGLSFNDGVGLVFNKSYSSTLTFADAISGLGSLTINGTGDSTFSGNISFSSSGLAVLNNTGTLTFNGMIDGSGALSFDGSGTDVVLNGDIGSLTAPSSLNLNSMPVTINANITTAGAQNYTSTINDIAIDRDVKFKGLTTSSDIIFTSSLDYDSSHDVAIETSGNIEFLSSNAGALLENAGTGQIQITAGNQMIFPGSNAYTTSASMINYFLASLTIDSGNVSTYLNDIASKDLYITTTSGNINLQTPFSWASANDLKLSSFSDILSSASIINTGGGNVTLIAGNTGTGIGTVSFSSGNVSLSGGSGKVNVYYNPTVFGTQDVIYNGGTTPSQFMLINTLGDATDTTTRSLASLSNNTELWDQDFALAKNIDASATSTWNEGAGWSPIGHYNETPYSGVFDGQNFSIDGLVANRPTEDRIGLFGHITNGTIKNLSVTNATIIGNSRVGILSGGFGDNTSINNNIYTEVDNVFTSGSVEGMAATDVRVAGLIGSAFGLPNQPETLLIQNSHSSATVTSHSSSFARAAGLVGLLLYGTVDNSYATGTINQNGTAGRDTGGLIGAVWRSVINNSYATNDVYALGTAGGLIGYITNETTVSGSYSTGNLYTTGGYSGGLIGWTDGNSSIDNSYTTGSVNDSTSSSQYIGGLVGYNISTDISNSHSSATINNNNGYYVGGLVGNNESGKILNSHTSNDVEGYYGVGGLVGRNVQGIIDNSYSTGNVTGNYYYTGGLVAYNNNGTILNSYNAGSVTGGSYYTGGVIGYTSSSSIHNSYNTGNITGNYYVGGIAGYENASSIESSYNLGNVSGASYVGGLSGRAFYSSQTYSIYSNSYNQGNISGSSYVGGLIGYLYNYTNSYALLNNYSAGEVSGSSYVGGLIGYIAGSVNTPTTDKSYWDTSIGPGVACGNNACTGFEGKTTSELQQQATFTDWDFDQVWNINEGSAYPTMQTHAPIMIIQGRVPGYGGIPVKLAIDGTVVDTATTESSQQKFYFRDSSGLINDNSSILVYLDDQAITGNILLTKPTRGFDISGLTLSDNTLQIGGVSTTNTSTTSTVRLSNLINAYINDDDVLYSVSNNEVTFLNGPAVNFDSTVSFHLDGVLNALSDYTLSNTTLSGDSTINTGANNFTLGSTLNSIGGNYGLTINNTGTTNINADIGGTTPLSFLTINSNAISLGATLAEIKTTNDQTYNAPVTLNGSLLLESSLGSIIFNDTITSPITSGYVFSSCVPPACSSTYTSTGDSSYTTLTSKDEPFNLTYSGNAIELPFDFEFYGDTYSTLYLDPNGLVTFSNAGYPSYTYNTNSALPNTSIPNALIAPLWADLWVTSQNIYYQTTGSGNNRAFTAEFRDVGYYSSQSSQLNFQVKLFEADNHVEIHYGDFNNSAISSPYVIGIENATGSQATTYINGVNVSGTDLMNTYVPNGTVLSFTPYSGPSGSLTISGNAEFHGEVSSIDSLSVSGTTTVANNVTTVGAQTYTGETVLAGNVTFDAGSNDITFSGGINSASVPQALTIDTDGDITITGDVGNSVALASLTANAGLTFDGNITTTGSQTYNQSLIHAGNHTLTLSGANTAGIYFDNISGSGTLNIVGAGSGRYELAVNSGGAQTWRFTGLDSGTLAGSSIDQTINFNNMRDLTGSSANDTYQFIGNARNTGFISAGPQTAMNTIDLTQYNQLANLTLSDLVTFNGSLNNASDGAQVASFININSITNKPEHSNAKINFPAGKFLDLRITSAFNGEIADPLYFTSFGSFAAGSGGGARIIIDGEATFNPNNMTVTIGGVTMSFAGFLEGQFSGSNLTNTNDIATVIQQPPTNLDQSASSSSSSDSSAASGSGSLSDDGSGGALLENADGTTTELIAADEPVNTGGDSDSSASDGDSAAADSDEDAADGEEPTDTSGAQPATGDSGAGSSGSSDSSANDFFGDDTPSASSGGSCAIAG